MRNGYSTTAVACMTQGIRDRNHTSVKKKGGIRCVGRNRRAWRWLPRQPSLIGQLKKYLLMVRLDDEGLQQVAELAIVLRSS